MSDLVKITIDGQELEVPKGTLLVEAARQIGVEIPVYCYHPKMKPVGACRVCLVEVEKQRRPMMTACTTTVMPDMVVHTRSENAIKAREGILEFLLINHPLDCPVCDRGGECDLQDFTLRYGPPTTRFVEKKRHFEKSKQVGANVILDRERCIMCQRCVRFCDEIAMEEGLVIIERGYRSEIGTFEGRSFDSQFSGNTIEICPVGALTAKTYRFKARPWELQHFEGICNQCSVGCNLTVDVRFDEIARCRSRVNEAIDDGWLCDRGRYGFAEVHADNRILKPRIGDKEVSWEAALKKIGEKLGEAKKVGAVVGTKVGNEAGWAWSRLMRSVLKTADVDHAGNGLSEPPPTTAKIHGLDDCAAVVLIDCDPTATHPVIDIRVKKALRNGARLISVGGDNGLQRYSDVVLSGVAEELLDELKAGVEATKDEETGPRNPKPRPWEPGGESSNERSEAVSYLAGGPVCLIFAEGADKATMAAAKRLADTLDCQAPQGLLCLYNGTNSLGLKEMGVGSGWLELEDYNFDVGKDHGGIQRAGLQLLFAVEDESVSEKKADFLVALSTHSCKTTEIADVVLPVCSWAEQTQTFTNTDGSVQLSRQALAPLGESKPSWEVAKLLSEALESPWEPASARAVYGEIGRLNPLYEGSTYADFSSPAQQHWSYPQQGKLGTPRPDLSAIPVNPPDAPPWIPAEAIGSSVERAARLTVGDRPPAVPGQEDPREVARRLGLSMGLKDLPSPKEDYVPLRVVSDSQVQPPGPSPAHRHHTFGVGARHLAHSSPAAVAEAEADEAEDGGEEV